MAKEKTAFHALKAVAVAAKKKERPQAAVSEGERWWEGFFAHREAKGLSPVRFFYNPHIKPALAGKHPKEWTREDCERLVWVLDAKVATDGAAKISWKTAANIWGLFTRACKVASSAKAASGLRVRLDNPCLGIEGPDRGEKKTKQWLFPSELSMLLACEDVPLRWRRLYALLAYTYVRPSELKVLSWDDVDLDVGTIHVTKAWDRARTRLKPPKTAAGV